MKAKKNVRPRDTSLTKTKIFPIVAIGASAGGLEAITSLLKYLPSDTGMAYIYIQHLDPTHKSMLPTILAKATKMKVADAKHLMRVEPNCLYIIPPNKDMTLVDGVLMLQQRKGKPHMHMPIDKFFISLAEKQKEGAIAILLSGSGSDGTLGMKAIKTEGGIGIAQDESAKFEGMPRSAVAEGVIDMVLSPKQIADELKRLSKQVNMLQEVMQEDAEDTVSNADESLLAIIQLLKKVTKVDFAHYKIKTVKRRIIRRMLLHKFESLNHYAQYLRQHPTEINALYQDLLINVTQFFRDPDVVEYLKKTLLPAIVKRKLPNEPIRIWVAACSTGEEAYSLAMILVEVLGDRMANTPIQIFATDLSEAAIVKARLGLYSRHDLVDVSPKRLQRFFTRVDGSFQINKSIRDLCIFAPHNLFKDPPFSRIDLVSCCNLLIYLDAISQKKVIATFHYALNNNGYLVLGKSETIGTTPQLFTQAERKYKIYARKNDANNRAVLEMTYRLPVTEKNEMSEPRKPAAKNRVEPIVDLEKMVDTVLLTKYIPACVVVNQDLEILQFRGSTGLFLEPSPGKASLNLLKMAKPGLAFELRNAIHKANKTGRPVQKNGLEIISNKSTINNKEKENKHKISIEVLPLKSDGEERLSLVTFQENNTPAEFDPKSSLSKDRLVKQLREELETVREDMRSIVEEQEASNEELQSANEEIVSSNEELQSINEELETSKEEVESTNEELMTMNTELQIRNEQLTEAHEYGEAVYTTIREGVVFLDKDLRVKSANRSFYKTFQVKEENTEGSPIYELGNKQWNIPRLRELLEDIIPRNSVFNDFEVRHTFPEIGEKVMVLNAKKITLNRQQLILLTMQDITEHRQAEKIIAEREAWLRNMTDNVPVMIWMSGKDKHFNFFNSTWLKYTGRHHDQEKGSGWMDGIHKDDLSAFLSSFNSGFREKKTFQAEFRLRRHDGKYYWLVCTGKPNFSTEGEFIGYTGSCTEIHDKMIMTEELEKKVLERTKELEEINSELERSNNDLQQFAYVASHDLQEPLRKIITFSDRLLQYKEILPAEGQNYTDKIVNSSERMRRLIDDLLNFSRTSRMAQRFKMTDLTDILKDVLIDFDLVIKEKKAKVKFKQLPVAPAIPVQMEQLFHNLVSNALKFSRDNTPPVIDISWRKLTKAEIQKQSRLDKKQSYFDLIFKDNGIGFNAEFAEQIFVIFQRLNSREEYPGTGIGLALCKKIVRNHGGEIYAVSKENNGAAFHVILPYPKQEAEG